MNRNNEDWAGVIISLGLLTIVGVIAFHYFVKSVSWTAVSATASPNGHYRAIQVWSNDDGVGPSPYGQHIFITSSWFRKFPENDSEIIFGGYCEALHYAWTNDRTLSIECKLGREGRISRKMESFKNVTIHYEIRTSTMTHNIGLNGRRP